VQKLKLSNQQITNEFICEKTQTNTKQKKKQNKKTQKNTKVRGRHISVLWASCGRLWKLNGEE